jgi:hypothetical protein
MGKNLSLKQEQYFVEIANELLFLKKKKCPKIIDDGFEGFFNFYKSRSLPFLYISFKCDETPSKTDTGAGPIPNTVLDPAAICVRPASSIK